MLKCLVCKLNKVVEAFNKDPNRKSGRHPWCKECFKEYRKTHYKKNREKYIYQAIEWKQKNRERARISARITNTRCKQRMARTAKIWAKQNPGGVNAHSIVSRAIKSGTLIKPNSCSLCNTKELTIYAHHHKGYENPLEIMWICASCHRREHAA